MKTMPSSVAEIRRELCPDCSANYADPCDACPHGKWGPYVRCEPELPPAVDLAKNLGAAVVAETAAMLRGDAKITPEQAAERFAVCQGCDWFRASDERCAHPSCGCFLRVKTAWRAQRCPVGKW